MKSRRMLVWIGVIVIAMAIGIFVSRRSAPPALEDAIPASGTQESPEVAQPGFEDERSEAPEEERAVAAGAEVASEEPKLPVVEDVAASMEWGADVVGRVVPERDGELLKTAPDLSLRDLAGGWKSVSCASDGSFTISNIAAGVYWLSATAGEQGRGTKEFEIVPGLQRLEVVVRLERPWSLDVIARNGSAELRSGSQAFAVATIEPLGERFDESIGKSVKVCGFGVFNPGRRPDSDPDSLGTLEIGVDVPVWVHLVRRRTVLDRKRVLPGATAVEFDLTGRDLSFAPGALQGRLFAADTGMPLARRSVSLEGESTSVMLGPTDEEGRFKFAKLEPGPWRVTLFEVGFRWDVSVVIEPGAELDLGDVYVSNGIRLSGRVIGAQAGQLPAHVRHERLDDRTGEPVWSGGIRVLETDAEGWFVAAGLAPGRHRLSFDGRALPLVQKTVELKDVPVEGVELELAPATDLCVLFAREAEPADWLDVVSSTGERLAHKRLVPGSPTAFRVVAGTYTVRVGEHERQVVVGDRPVLVRLP